MNQRDIWPKNFSNKSINATIIVISFLNLIYFNYHTPIPLLILIFGVTIFFFNSLHHFTKEWQCIPDRLFYVRLFWFSVFFRLTFLGLIYLYTYLYDPSSLPFEAFAADAWRYWDSGQALTGNIFNGEFLRILSQYWRSEADWGFPFYLGLINSLFFNSILLVKFLNIIWGSVTVVLLAKISEFLFTKKHARLTGIIAMLMPSLMSYNANYLKETLMIFIIVFVFYKTIKMVKTGRFELLASLLILMGTVSLFYFRTVLAVIVSLSIITYFFFNLTKSKRSRGIVLILALIFIGGIYTISYQLNQIEEVKTQYTQLGGEAESRITGKLSLVNLNVKTSIAIPLVMANAFFSPYPSFLNLDERQISVILHAHNEISRITLYYFAFLGILILLRRNLKNSILIIFFTVGYILILALTGASYFERFHLPVVPFMIILMAVGLINSPNKWYYNWNKYIVIIWLVVIFWHLFKLNIRGLF